MKILIEESVLRQALETFTHCYAETDRRINERAKILVELRTVLDAVEKGEPVAWVIRTDNTNLHELDPNKTCSWLDFDVEQFKHNAARSLKIVDAAPLYTHPAPAIPEGFVLVPKEPTEEMWKSAEDLYDKVEVAFGKGQIPSTLQLYKAMLAAAPKPEESK